MGGVAVGPYGALFQLVPKPYLFYPIFERSRNMAGPNQGPVYYCRGAESGALYGGSIGRLLENEGCVEGGASYNFRQHNHPCCKACRKLVDPEYPKGNGAWFMLEVGEVRNLHADANVKDETAHAQWSATTPATSSARRSRSPIIRPLSTSEIGNRQVKDCTVEHLMRYIRSMP